MQVGPELPHVQSLPLRGFLKSQSLTGREAGVGDGKLNTILSWTITTWLTSLFHLVHATAPGLFQVSRFLGIGHCHALRQHLQQKSVANSITSVVAMRLVQFHQILPFPSLLEMFECAAEVPGLLGDNIRGGLQVVWFMAEMVGKISSVIVPQSSVMGLVAPLSHWKRHTTKGVK